MHEGARRRAWQPVAFLGAAALAVFVYATRLNLGALPLSFWAGALAVVGCALIARQPRLGWLEGAAIVGLLHIVLVIGALGCAAPSWDLNASLASPQAMSQAISGHLLAAGASWWLVGVIALATSVALLPHEPVRWLVIVACPFTILLAKGAVMAAPWLDARVAPHDFVVPALGYALGVWIATGVAGRAPNVRLGLSRMLAGVSVVCAAELTGLGSLAGLGWGMHPATAYDRAVVLRSCLAEAHDHAWFGLSIGVALVVAALVSAMRSRDAVARSGVGTFGLLAAAATLAFVSIPRSSARLMVAVVDHAVAVERRPPARIPIIHPRADDSLLAVLHVRAEIDHPDAEVYLDARGAVLSREIGHLIRVHAPAELPLGKLVTALDRIADARGDVFELRLEDSAR